jgi:hypothetical protein
MSRAGMTAPKIGAEARPDAEITLQKMIIAFENEGSRTKRRLNQQNRSEGVLQMRLISVCSSPNSGHRCRGPAVRKVPRSNMKEAVNRGGLELSLPPSSHAQLHRQAD